jgi:hypothetical protein
MTATKIWARRVWLAGEPVDDYLHRVAGVIDK